MATYTDLTDWSNLQVGDVINYTTDNISIDATGYKFGCRLKGYSGHDTSSYKQVSDVWGANCYAEFDFRNVSDGGITLGYMFGSYIAITNGDGSDIRYNRIMVAGHASYLGNSSSTVYRKAGSAGLFNDSAAPVTGYNYYLSGQWRTATCSGGGQQAGGQVTNYYSGTTSIYNGDFGYRSSSQQGSNTDSGWYGGAVAACTNGGTTAIVSSGGSSYILTSNSYKPTGYFSEWTDYVNNISNATSELLNADRDYYCTITILEIGGGGSSTHNVYRYGVVDSHTVVIPNSASDVTYNTLPCTEWEFNENVTPWNGHITTLISEFSYDDIIISYCTDNTAYSNHEYDYVTYNNTNYPIHDNISTAPIFSGIIPSAKQKADTYQDFTIVICDDIILSYQDLPGKRLKFGYFNGGSNMNVVNHGMLTSLYVDNKNYTSLFDWLINNATLVNAGQTVQVDEHGWQPCSLKYYDGTDWVDCDPMTYHNGDWE